MKAYKLRMSAARQRDLASFVAFVVVETAPCGRPPGEVISARPVALSSRVGRAALPVALLALQPGQR